jgi:solute:Na+ symporter, SSS family
LGAVAIAGPHDGLRALDYVAVAAYLAATLGIVLWSLRRQSSTDDFFLGGRRMPWLAVGLSLMATLMSTMGYIGVPGEVIKHGIALFCGSLVLPLSMAVVLLMWVPFFMRLRMTSAYEYLERRFDYRARLLAGSLFVLLRLGWMAVVVYTAALALSQMTDLPLLWIVVAVGLAATAYTCVGGMGAIIWTDVLQFVMLFGGMLITLGYVVWATGTGPSHWWATVSAHAARHTRPPLFSLDPTVRVTVVTAMVHSFFWTICTHGSDQVVLQRYFSTTSLASARRSYVVNALAELALGGMLALSGLALLSFYLEHPSFLPPHLSPTSASDRLLPYFFAHQLPVGLGGLLLASFLCDAMQTLDSGVNSITAVAETDVVSRVSPRGVGRLALARMLTVAVGLAATLLAFAVSYHVEHSGRSIIDLMPRSFNMFLGPLASLFFIGMFLPRCTSRSAIPSVLCGLAIAIAWSYWKELFGTPYQPTITLAIAVPCLSALAIAAVLGLVAEAGGNAQGRDYSWWSVMRRPVPGGPAGGRGPGRDDVEVVSGGHLRAPAWGAPQGPDQLSNSGKPS